MNALLIALTMSLAGAEGTFDGPGTLSRDLPILALRALPEPAPFPLTMNLSDVEAAVVETGVARLDLRSAGSVTLAVAFELPSCAELQDGKPFAVQDGLDGPSTRPWLTARLANTPEPLLPWLKDWDQR